MNENFEYKGTGRELRTKIVNLLYLIFIILAFLYIPADFVDIFRDIDKSFKDSEKENIKLSFYNKKIFELMSQSNADSTEFYIRNYLKANNSSTNIINKIEICKQNLIQKTGGYDEHKFLKNAKDYSTMEKFFLRQNLADSIAHHINMHKNLVRPIVDSLTYMRIDSLLYVGKIRTSAGFSKNWVRYYFDKMPMAAAITLLSKFQNDIRKTDNMIIESYIMLLAKNDSLISSTLKQNLEAELTRVKNEIFNLGEEIILAIESKDIMSEDSFFKIKAYVEYGSEIDSLNIDSFGRISFYPYKEGKYKFTVIIDKNILQKIIEVRDIGTVLEIMKLPTLYTGIDNLIKIYHNKFKDKDIDVDISSGELIYKDSKYYARFKSPGLIEINVYSTYYKEKKLLSTKKFIVKDLPDIKAVLYGRQSGVISQKILKIQKNLELKSDFVDNINFNIKEFDIKRINKNITESNKNEGAYFTSLSRKIIDNAEKGDIFIFDNIKVEKIMGNEIEIPSIVLNVK
ncbi:MAG: hypothetical protein K8R58_02885 [Bacteroidales bacterium]|nr:hypothetical protein [Bacteroidales bacterium]